MDDTDNRLERMLTPRQVCELEAISLTTVYFRLADGSYKGFKDGKKTLITESSVARRRETLRRAKYGVRKGIRGIQPKAEAAAS